MIAAMDTPASITVPVSSRLWKAITATIMALLLTACQGNLKPILSADADIAASLAARVGPGASLEDITYCSGDGWALQMDLQYPQRIAARMPVVFYIHGGAWVKGSRRNGYLTNVYRRLRARGIIAGAVSYRLAPGSDIRGMIGDLKCAVRFMRAYARELHIAPDAIGAMGSSAGGHLTAMLGVTDKKAGLEGSGGYPDQSSRINAAVPVAPALDLTRLNEFEQKAADMAVAALGGSERENELLSPYIHVSGDDPPFLIIQGDNDEKILTTEQAKRFHRKLVEAGVNSRLLIIGGADHAFGRYTTWMSMTRKQIWRTIADFFDEKLNHPVRGASK